ncbi:Glycosyltransferase involved in cell wall bisynthesis [Planctomicrobium piriforme]|uniref:Glycosyltransferase involved in cell wall bisynthesis n=2 Tax=Planctomicrobium piriforme TaxID=1576369 RepID=A0A1I3K251_9PLAN|nr:Glycosyltransferase involved in cell wall bisynthesis [Planctomicrobium piriforme]
MVPSLESGGVERGTLEVNDELVRQGHRSIVISGGGRLVPQLIKDGGEHVTWNIGKKSLLSLKWVWPLRKLLRDENVHIVHARSRVPAWIAWLAWRGMSKKQRPRFITTAHGLYSVNRYSAIMASGERVISISEAVDQYLRTSYPKLDPSRIRLIPRGIDPDEFPRGYQPSSQWLDQWYKDYPQLIGRPVVSLVGRMTRYKGHHEFLEIIDRLRREVPDVHALIVGAEDPRRQGYASEIREHVRREKLESNVTFAGHRSDIREIYAVSNVIMALSSKPPEAFGRATVEALNIGTPVVGWDSGGTSELLRHIYPQGLVPPGNIEQAVEKVKQVLAEGASLPSDHPYLKHYMLQKTLALYEEMAA